MDGAETGAILFPILHAPDEGVEYLLLQRKAKTNERVPMVACFIVLAGHWLDLYLMVLPPVLKGASPSFGVSEAGGILLQFGLGHMACWPVFMKNVNPDQELPQAG